MSDSLKSKAIKGFGWSAAERFSVQGVTFVVQLILARLLTPEDYGIVGMLAIFLQIAQVFIDSGFANALIQKKDCSDYDYSTVFFFNLIVSLSIYAILFVSAPLISNFYNIDILTPVLRLISITLVINALTIVNRTILVKAINFRAISIISLFSVITSGCIGIFFAYQGFGVWSLCWQQISNSFLQWILFLIVVRWRPNSFMNKYSFHYLWKFGSRMLATSLIGAAYSNMYALVIGKKFTERDLGHYTRADQFASFPASACAGIVNKVIYPVFCKIQDDDKLLREAYRKVIRLTSYMIFPVMLGLMAITEPFIITFLTVKWNGAILFMQILCLDWILDHLSIINLNLLYVKGRTDLALRLEIIKKCIAVTILIITLRWGVFAMCIGRVLYSIIATFINTYYTERFIQLSFQKQIIDVLPYLLLSVTMAVIVYCSTMLFDSSVAQLIIGIIIGALVYLCGSLIFFRKTLSELKEMLLLLKGK